MDRLQHQLDPAIFIRVSRGAIVRLQAIRHVRQRGAGNYAIALEGGTEVPCSKTYWDPAQS
jgi:DNA-binding LytR/AlgR family response regulator